MTDPSIVESLRRLDDLAVHLCRLETLQKEFLKVEQAAEFVGLSKVQLDEWRSKGGGPAWHKVGRRVLYSVHDLREFMAQHRREPLM